MGWSELSVFLALALAAYWIALLLRLQRASVRFPELTPASHVGPTEQPLPTVSLVVAVKDGEAEIEDCVRSLLGQDYPGLDITVVDDRSSDGTRTILERLASEASRAGRPRLRVLGVEQLPDGWGGQNHALHLGVKSSKGQLLCFTDADCRFDSPRTLSIAVEELLTTRADLFSLLPSMSAPTFWEKVYLPLCSFMLLLGLRITDVNDEESDAAYANGAFLMVRRSTYDALGGHERVRFFVNDDIRMSELAKRGGFRLRVAKGRGLCRTRMYDSVRGAYDGWTRNFLGCLERPHKLAAASMQALCLCVLPTLGLLGAFALERSGAHFAVTVWFAPLIVAQAGLFRLYASFDVRARWALAYFAGALFVLVILVRATLRALLRRGTRWHGVSYPTTPA
jgi:glycosyltransferase involved in cell wall biosynthesis